MYIDHPRWVFLAGYGWFEEKILYFNTQICVYHILFIDGTTNYVAAENFDGIELILFFFFNDITISTNIDNK